MSTTDFNITRDSLIKGALRLCGVLAQGEEPTTFQISEASETLNLMVKAWQADGMPLWAIKQYNIPLVAAQRVYTIGVGCDVDTPKPLKLIQAWNHNILSKTDIPIRIISRQEYNILGNKETSGNPIQVYYDPQNMSGDLSVFPVPTSVEEEQNVITIVYQRPFTDFDSDTDYPDFPQEWHEAIKYGLAYRLSGEYNLSLDQRKVLKAEADEMKYIALSFGTEEASLFFQVDHRSW